MFYTVGLLRVSLAYIERCNASGVLEWLGPLSFLIMIDDLYPGCVTHE